MQIVVVVASIGGGQSFNPETYNIDKKHKQ
jgi:hypothetical protein